MLRCGWGGEVLPQDQAACGGPRQEVRGRRTWWQCLTSAVEC